MLVLQMQSEEAHDIHLCCMGQKHMDKLKVKGYIVTMSVVLVISVKTN